MVEEPVYRPLLKRNSAERQGMDSRKGYGQNSKLIKELQGQDGGKYVGQLAQKLTMRRKLTSMGRETPVKFSSNALSKKENAI